MRALALAAAALALGGCGGGGGTAAGGAVVGDTVTVHSLLPRYGPHSAATRDLVDGQKLALLESGGKVAGLHVDFVARDLGSGDLVAERVREAMSDTQIIAAIADVDSTTARVTVPLLNAAGILHVSPGATYPGFVAQAAGTEADEPERWRPSGRQSLAPVPPGDPAQAWAMARAARGRVAVEAEAGEATQTLAANLRDRLGDRLTGDTARARTIVYVGDDARNAQGVIDALAREAPRARIILPEYLLRTDLARRLAPEVRRRVRFMASAQPPADIAAEFERHFGRCAGPYAGVGYRAMRGVLDALARAGRAANRRQAVIRAYFRTGPLESAATQPWLLATGPGCDDDYVPVG